jgi:hypothetical protein
MIPIIVDKKKYKIKAIHELSTREFIELSKIELLNVQRYIAWQCSLDEAVVFFIKVSPAIEASIGTVPDITRINPPKRFNYKRQIETIGQRHQVEQCGKTGFELLVFTLAVAQARSNNIDDVNKLYNEYMQQPFYEILPAGFFFFKRYSRGRRSVQGILKKLPGLKKILN